jgi:hypothetical protein
MTMRLLIDYIIHVKVPMPYKEAVPTLRPRKEPKAIDIYQTPPPDRSRIEWLEYGLQTRKHETLGWLKHELISHNLLVDTKAAIWALVLSDYACLQAARDGMEKTLGAKYVDPREHKGVQGKKSGGKFVSLKKASQMGVPKNMWAPGHLIYAYGVDRATFRRRLKAEKEGMVIGETIGKHIGTSVISNRQLARERYDAKFFYAREKALTNREPTKADQNVPEWDCYKYRVAYWEKEFEEKALDEQDMSYYARLAREHDERQPFVQQDILDALIEGHSCHSYRALSKHINDWCSPWTIEKWFKSHPS